MARRRTPFLGNSRPPHRLDPDNLDDQDFIHQIIFSDSDDDSIDDPDIFPSSGENNDSESENVTSDTDVDNEETEELDEEMRHSPVASLPPSRPTTPQQSEVIWEWGSGINYVPEILEFDSCRILNNSV